MEVTRPVTRLLVGQTPLLAKNTPTKRHKLVLVGHVDLCSTVGPMRVVSLNYHVGRSRTGDVMPRDQPYCANTYTYSRARLMLYFPWYDEDVHLLCGYATYKEHYHNYCASHVFCQRGQVH